ncbi:carbohydrate ABC transporter permease [Paenibacillus psychroresistens]|uniref:Carbohydrate ABC transporter permease n=1 Tax=Paenibacillus psychroresistens TaxID=1778678 RepID=A0A6B8RFY6_9BACL|nr:carbohydrate ABC transporter permease [Paenibacillus psychroresistens]QGQ94276.1 carbohydrate ABC transporter permease [Paenibacillus psychroresistens]
MKKNHIPLIIIGIIVSLIMILPFLWGVVFSFKNNNEIFNSPLGWPEKFDFSLYLDTFKKAHIATLFMNSLILAIVTSVIEIGLLFFSSFAIARLYHKSHRVTDLIYYLFLSASAIPVLTLLMPYYFLALSLGKVTGGILGVDSIWGLMLPYIAGGIPFMTLMLVGGMRGIPLEMEEAGIIDGSGLMRLIFSVEIPLLSPVLVTMFIFSFLGVWNEFPIASIQLHDKAHYTLPLAMAFFKDEFSSDYGAMLRGVVIILLPQVVFFLIMQRRIMDGMVTSGLKG